MYTATEKLIEALRELIGECASELIEDHLRDSSTVEDAVEEAVDSIDWAQKVREGMEDLDLERIVRDEVESIEWPDLVRDCFDDMLGQSSLIDDMGTRLDDVERDASDITCIAAQQDEDQEQIAALRAIIAEMRTSKLRKLWLKSKSLIAKLRRFRPRWSPWRM